MNYSEFLTVAMDRRILLDLDVQIFEFLLHGSEIFERSVDHIDIIFLNELIKSTVDQFHLK